MKRSLTLHVDSPIHMNIRPTANRVLLRPVEPEKKVGLIHVPDAAQKEQQQGIVVGVGPQVLGVKTNDKVIFGKFAGTALVVENVPLLMVTEDDIVGVIEEG